MGWEISVGTSVSLTDMCLYLPVTLPATIMTSSVPTTVGGHMMYPSPHAVMYAPTSGLADGSLTVLNAFSQAPSTMQVSHSQVQEQGGVPQVFLTAPSGTVQIPVSAVQLHQVGGSPFHPIPPSQLLLYLDLGDSITGWSKLRSLAWSPLCFPGQTCGGQAGKQEEPELTGEFLPHFLTHPLPSRWL